MKSYIHLYRTNSEFTEVYNGPDYDEPWISLTEENMEVNYNKTPPEPPKVLTAITFENLTWITDIPSTGGTATKDNCTYTIMAKYIGSEPEDITSQVTVTGELSVEASTIEQRHEAGQLTLTASYCGFTTTANVTVYQEAFNFSMAPLTFKILSGGTIYWSTSARSLSKTIEYKLNDGEWKSITSNTWTSAPTIKVNADDKIQFRGDNTAYGAYSSQGTLYNTFYGSTAIFEIEGNIMSLINSTNFAALTTLQSNYTFSYLFRNCTELASAENLILPATTLTSECYQYMFYGCTSLTTAPKLPATELAYDCYYNMFYNCSSLINAPALPATTLASGCYYNMFDGCSSLKTAPSILPATAVTNDCYNGMFQGCTSLTTAPVLPATTLAYACYKSMFYGCTSLNYIKCLATNIPSSSTGGWVDGVAATGTFIKNPSMSKWTTGNNGIPNNWTVQDAS